MDGGKGRVSSIKESFLLYSFIGVCSSRGDPRRCTHTRPFQGPSVTPSCKKRLRTMGYLPTPCLRGLDLYVGSSLRCKDVVS